MFRLIILAALLGASALSTADSSSATGSSDVSNAASYSGSQVYNQTNYNNNSNYNIEGVRCPVPTFNLVGGVSTNDTESRSNPLRSSSDAQAKTNSINLGFSYPLGTTSCESAALLKVARIQNSNLDNRIQMCIRVRRYGIIFDNPATNPCRGMSIPTAIIEKLRK